MTLKVTKLFETGITPIPRETQHEFSNIWRSPSAIAKLLVKIYRGGSRSRDWRGPYGERGARAYNGGLGAVPPAGSRGRAPGRRMSEMALNCYVYELFYGH